MEGLAECEECRWQLMPGEFGRCSECKEGFPAPAGGQLRYFPGRVYGVSRWFGAYKHVCVYLRNGIVFQFTGEPLAKGDAMCRLERLESFIQRSWYVSEVASSARTLSVSETIKRCLGMAGVQGYNVLYNNCEHAARWAATGQAVCDQYWFGYKDMQETQRTMDHAFARANKDALGKSQTIRTQLKVARVSDSEIDAMLRKYWSGSSSEEKSRE